MKAQHHPHNWLLRPTRDKKPDKSERKPLSKALLKSEKIVKKSRKSRIFS